MRAFTLITLLIISFSTVSAQTISNTVPNTTDSTTDSSMAYLFCEVMPTMKTKEYKSFEEYVMKNTIYPPDAKAAGQGGVSYIQFIVEIDGSVSNVQVVKGREIYPACDQEAIRVISNSPKWTPGLLNGEAIRVKKISRISFNL